jgi:hypothetical protein
MIRPATKHPKDDRNVVGAASWSRIVNWPIRQQLRESGMLLLTSCPAIGYSDS